MIDTKWIEKFGKIRHIHLAHSTWFRVGGYADVFKPHRIESLCHFVKENPYPLTVLGATSNLLVRDAGIPGVTLRLGSSFLELFQEDDVIIAGAACFDRDIAYFAEKCGLEGLEFLVGIPGQLGGAVFMNAGAYGSDIKSCLLWVDIVNEQGELTRLDAQDIPMHYRHAVLPKNAIVIRAALKGKKQNSSIIAEKIRSFLEKREESQPIRSRTGGSTFKNPEGSFAWKLIDEAGCRGLCFNGAQVSEKHCNFLINTGNATAYDLETLGEDVRKRVLEKSGILLEWEIKRIGTIKKEL